MVVSRAGHGLFDAVTGEKIARDRDPDPDEDTPDASPDLSCPGLGPIAGSRVRMAGLFGGGFHTVIADSWVLEVVTPAWPNDRVLLSRDGGCLTRTPVSRPAPRSTHRSCPSCPRWTGSPISESWTTTRLNGSS
jgi:hypothetical protein